MNSTLRKWLRVVHRDLGYFLVGITIVYAVSGFLLSHKNTFAATKTITSSACISKNIPKNGFIDECGNSTGLALTHCSEKNGFINFYFEGGRGVYDPGTGNLEYEKYVTNELMLFVNQLHCNQKKGWFIIADFYALSLLFLAVSGLFIVPGRNGFAMRGIWFVLAGMVVIVFYVFMK